MGDGVQIISIGPGELAAVEPLWLALHAHHQALAPSLAPFVADDLSWPLRRRQYETLLADGGEVLLAKGASGCCGYAAWGSHRMPWPAAFKRPARVAELFSLFVTPEFRGLHVGKALLAEFMQRAEGAGLAMQVIGALPGNIAAIAFYQRHGFCPTWTTLTSFGRPLLLEPSLSFARATWNVEDVGPGDVDQLRPLWTSLHHHHMAVAPQLAPFVDDDASWEAYRPTFLAEARHRLLFRLGPVAAPKAMLCAEVDANANAYADTWHFEGPIVEIEVLTIDASLRNQGAGRALLQALVERLSHMGINNLAVGAVATNADAIRFYERIGFRPTWLQSTRYV